MAGPRRSSGGWIWRCGVLAWWLAAAALPAVEPIQSIALLRSLPASDILRGVAVEVRATVTFTDPAAGLLFVHDGSAGLYVFPGSTPRPALVPGQQVLVRGRSRIGLAPPSPVAVQEVQVDLLDQGRVGVLPTARPLVPGESSADRDDAAWVSVEGVVRGWRETLSVRELDLAVGEGRVSVRLPADPGPFPEALRHARVAVAGVWSPEVDPARGLRVRRLFCPGWNQIRVVEAAVPMAQLRLLTAAESAPGPVSGPTPLPMRGRLEGLVTFALPGGALFLQGGAGTFEVSLARRPERPIEPGEWLALAAYPVRRPGRAAVEDAEILLRQTRSPALPFEASAEDWRTGARDGQLVQVDGRFVQRLPTRTDPGGARVERLAVHSGDALLEVHLPEGPMSRLGAGTPLRLTGVSVADWDEAGAVRAWQVWLRDGRDLEVLPAAWWDWRGGGRPVLPVIAVLLLALVGWALFLWRELTVKRLQTEELESRIVVRTAELLETNSSLRREVNERSRAGTLQAALYRISEMTHAVGDLPELYRQLHEVIATLMPARNFFIALHHREDGRLSFPYWVDERLEPPLPRPWANGLVEQVIRRRTPLLLDRERILRMAGAGEIDAPVETPLVWLGVPLMAEGRAFGVMAVKDYTGGAALDAEHQRILTYVAGQTATAIERKRAQAALRQSQAALEASQRRFQGAFASSPALMCLARLHDGAVVEVNDAFLAGTGHQRADVIGRSTLELGLWREPGDLAAMLDELRTRGSVRGREVVTSLGGGNERTFLVGAELLELDGEPGFLLAGLDVTDRKEVEEQLRIALTRERELGDLKSNFVALVSHEFRTPLEIILSSSEILERYDTRLAPEQRGQKLRAIQTSVRRMAEMMNEVLLLGRIEADRVEFEPADVDLPALMRRLAEEISASTPGAQVAVEAADGLDGARADESLLRHIFTNLLSNAVKYSPPGQPVRFTARREGTDAVFGVEDRGCGIPAADQERLFESFRRGSNVGQRSGTGLGLVIVKRCVGRHGGVVSLVSREGEGTLFTVRLPLFVPEPGLPGETPPDSRHIAQTAMEGTHSGKDEAPPPSAVK